MSRDHVKTISGEVAASKGQIPRSKEQESRMRNRRTRRQLNSQLHWGEGLPWWGHVLAIAAGFFIGIIHYALYKHK